MRSHIVNRTMKIAAVLVLAALVGACGGTVPKAPIKEQGLTGRMPETPTREVRTGDTLYSIAWESGRDYRELAEWNRIAPPYVIRPGQVLRLYPPSGSTPRPALRSEQKPAPKPEAPMARDKSCPEKIRDTKTGNRVDKTRGREIRSLVMAGGRQRGGALHAERIEQRHRHRRQKGQAVHAAAPGTVVYQGSGLRGYGELIIIKHDADFLSAYAHNEKILVKEGNVIRRGQKIAEMGAAEPIA